MRVEKKFVNASKRLVAFYLIEQILEASKGEDPAVIRFTLSCLGNVKTRTSTGLSHYLDDLKGCGLFLEDKISKVFFNILSLIAQHITNFDYDTESLSQLLAASFKWNFHGRDFPYLI